MADITKRSARAFWRSYLINGDIPLRDIILKGTAISDTALIGLLTLSVVLVPACRPAAAPVAISNQPLSGRQISKPRWQI